MAGDEISAALERLASAGLAVRNMRDNGETAYALNDAGKCYVEEVLLTGISDREQIYALGRLQGLKEAEIAATRSTG